MWLLLVSTVAAFLKLSFSSHLCTFGYPVDENIDFDGIDGSHLKDDLLGTYVYFETPYKQIWVNDNGILTFDDGNTQWWPEDPFPFTSSGTVLIAPFWADVDIASFSTGDIWIREAHAGNSPDTLDDVTSKIQQYYCIDNFTPTHAIVVTWEDVPHYTDEYTYYTYTYCYYYYHTYSYCTYTYESYEFFDGLENTFQVVIATDGADTYILFLYGDIEWTFGSDSIGDHAAVGLNAGDGERYWLHPDSHTAAIIDVETTSNVGVAGVWMFKVDGATILEPEDNCGVQCYVCEELEASGGGAAADAACNGELVTCGAGQICATKMRCRKQGQAGRFLISKKCVDEEANPFANLPSVTGLINKNGNFVSREYCGMDSCNSDAGARLEKLLNAYTSNCDLY